MKRKIIISLIFLGILTGGLVTVKKVMTRPLFVKQGISIVDVIPAKNLKSMVSQSEVIIVGSYQKYEYSFNGSRNVKDPSKESNRNYSEVRVYSFKVDTVLKGKISNKMIDVGMHYQSSENQLLDKNGKKMKLEFKDPLYIEPTFNRKQVLFLRYLSQCKPYANGEYKPYVYTASMEPYQIEIDKDGKALLKSNLTKKINKDHTITIIDGREVDMIKEVPELQDTISGMALQEIMNSISSFSKKAK